MENREPHSPISPQDFEKEIVKVLQTIFDPEIPVNIHDLGLIYDATVNPQGLAQIKMTLTAPGCPVAGSIVKEVESKVGSIPGVGEVKVHLVWDPPWNKDMMSDAAKLKLGML